MAFSVCAIFAQAQVQHEVEIKGGKVVVIQTAKVELYATSADLDKEIEKIEQQIKVLTDQKNVLLDLLRKVRAAEEKLPVVLKEPASATPEKVEAVKPKKQ